MTIIPWNVVAHKYARGLGAWNAHGSTEHATVVICNLQDAFDPLTHTKAANIKLKST